MMAPFLLGKEKVGLPFLRLELFIIKDNHHSLTIKCQNQKSFVPSLRSRTISELAAKHQHIYLSTSSSILILAHVP